MRSCLHTLLWESHWPRWRTSKQLVRHDSTFSRNANDDAETIECTCNDVKTNLCKAPTLRRVRSSPQSRTPREDANFRELSQNENLTLSDIRKAHVQNLRDELKRLRAFETHQFSVLSVTLPVAFIAARRHIHTLPVIFVAHGCRSDLAIRGCMRC